MAQAARDVRGARRLLRRGLAACEAQWKLLTENKLVIKVQTFPFDRAAEAYRISQAGHVRGKLVLVP